MRERIQTLDGLRFLAALGVLWTHTWTYHGNPRWYIGKFDLANILALGANGVDMFFAISGFCMYYFYSRKTDFSYHDFWRFLFKRWVRLSPAFYILTLVYILVLKFFYHSNINILYNLLHSVFYVNYFWDEYITASYYWTLGVEWQFYFIIPFLLIYQNKIGFKKTFSIIFGFILVMAILSVFITGGKYYQLGGSILFRGIEFGWGIIVARLILKNITVKTYRVAWMLLFLAITYAGRICISKPVLSLSVNYFELYRLCGFTLMSLGFSGILYLAVTSSGCLNSILGNRLFKTMGRISFSFYLLHGLIFPVIGNFTKAYLTFATGIAAPLLTTLLSAMILYPLSLLSYNLLEKPFLNLGNLTTK